MKRWVITIWIQGSKQTIRLHRKDWKQVEEEKLIDQDHQWVLVEYVKVKEYKTDTVASNSENEEA